MSVVSPRAIRLLALGDSYTIGEAVTPSERWPVRLAARFRERGIEVDEPVLVARTGWTTDELDAAIDVAGVNGSFDLVTLLIGVNNQYRGRALEEYGVQFRRLLDRAIGFARSRASRVIVVSIPDWGVTPFAQESGRDRDRIGVEISEFNTVAQAEAARAGANFVDITPESRRAATDRTLIAGDGLHPSGAMYEEWADMIFPVALTASSS